MKKKVTTKVIAGMLAFILTFANVILLGIYTQESIASSISLEEQSNAVANGNIEFDAYFMDEGDVKHSKDINMTSNNESIYLSLKVTDGYFVSGRIKVQESNFNLVKGEQELTSIQNIDVETNTITLNQINKNESVVLEIPIKMNTDSSFDLENLDKISNIILEGTYVDNKGEEIEVSKTINVNAKMKASAEIESNLEAEVTKNVVYESNGENGVVLQIEIKSEIVDSVMPIKSSKIEIDIPEINGNEPERVTLVTRGTKATNAGEERTVIENTDYTYENGKIVLIINNEQDENGIISWEKNVQDEIVLTCVYENETETPSVELNLSSVITLYDSNDTEINETKTCSVDTTIGEIITYELETNKEELAKGYMLVEGSKDTEFIENWQVNIGNRDLIDSINIEANETYYDETNTTYTADILYKRTRISEENLLSILGNDGYIRILNQEGEEITRLDKNNLEYIYSTDITKIKVETSEPISEGILKIENERAIKSGSLEVSQIKNINKLVVAMIGKTTSGEDKELLKEITLRNPETTIEVSINKSNLSTAEINDSIEIRIELDTNDNSKVLFKNAKATVELPKYIEELLDKKIALLYGQGLEINLANCIQSVNTEGNIVIEIPTNGEQTAFNTSSVSNGAVLVIQGKLKVDELTPAIKDSIKVKVDNENTLDTMAEDEIEVKYVAEKKVITRNAISGYDNTNDKVSTMSETKTATIKPSETEKTAKIELDAVNSTGKEISDVKILGRVPFEGNKNIKTDQYLGSTFSTSMASEIAISGIDAEDIDVYYSENGTATTDIDEETNGWSKIPSNITNVKSYLIVLKNSMANGEKVSFSYNVEIPENIGEEKETYETFAVCYKEDDTLKIEEANKIGLVTEKDVVVESSTLVSENDILEARLTMTSGGRVLEETDPVKEGQYIKYIVTIKNKTSNNQEFELQINKNNANLYGKAIMNYTLLTDDDVIEIREEGNEDVKNMLGMEGNTLKETVEIKQNETYTYIYTLVVNKDTAGEELENTISFVKNNEKILEDIKTNNLIQDGLLKVNIKYNNSEADKIIAGTSFSFIISVTNTTDNTLSNVLVEFELPDILTYNDFFLYKDACECDSMDTSTKVLKFTINSLEAGKTNELYILTDIGDIENDEAFRNIDLIATAKVNNEIIYSNTYGQKIEQGKTQIVASMSGSKTEEYLQDGDELIYTISVENRGIIDETGLTIKDSIPDGLVVEEYTIIDSNGEETVVETNYQILDISDIELKAHSSMTVRIKTQAVERLAEGNTLTNKATLEGRYFDEFDTNSVIYKFANIEEPTPEEPDNPTPDEPDDPTPIVSETFEINGVVWKDENQDGKRDTSESGMSGIQVKLMNNKKSEFVKDSRGIEITAITGEDGKYKFEELKSGEYVVVYVYDSNIYEPTTYQKTGVNTDVNSDAIVGTTNINGQEAKVAMTDTIIIGQSNVENIDLGLIQTKRFCLKVEKTIGIVIVQNKEGTKSYKFDTDLAKIEIPSKEMVGTNITVEYKIKVTNEGNISGRALKIVDNLPRDLEFKSEINNEWYKDTDGKIYTTEFEDDVIEPGESKEITLVLTKVLKEEAGEITNNTAEIVEIYNTLGIANSDQDTQKLNKADLIVTIKTGMATYITVTTVIMLMIGTLGAGIYLIKKKVLVERI